MVKLYSMAPAATPKKQTPIKRRIHPKVKIPGHRATVATPQADKSSKLKTPKSHLPGTPEAKKAARKRKEAKAKGLPTETDTLVEEAAFTRRFKDGEANASFANTNELAEGMAVPQIPTVQLIKAMADLVKHGAHADTAARCVGVNARVFRHWCNLGIEDPDSIYGHMLRALDAADAQDEVTDIQLITLGIKNWQALAWKRERKTAKRWRQQVAVGVTMVEEVLENSTRAQAAVNMGPPPETILETFERLGLLNRVLPRDPSATTVDTEADAPDPDTSSKAGSSGWRAAPKARPVP